MACMRAMRVRLRACLPHACRACAHGFMQDEMCLNFLFYYPRQPNIGACGSAVGPAALGNQR